MDDLGRKRSDADDGRYASATPGRGAMNTRHESPRPSVLLECIVCRTTAQMGVSSIEYNVLLAAGLVARPCQRCGQTTRWRAAHRSSAPSAAPTAKPAPAGVQDTRRAPRSKLNMQLRVRHSGGAVEMAQTCDVSKEGLCFVSNQYFSLGDETYITLPYEQDQAPTETKAKIVWMVEGAAGRFYGAEYVR